MDKKKVIDFQTGKEIENTEDLSIIDKNNYELNTPQELTIPEDFIETEENVNKILMLMSVYKVMGLDQEDTSEAIFMFIDMFGDCIGMVPPIIEE